jgi:hypothetical protein
MLKQKKIPKINNKACETSQALFILYRLKIYSASLSSAIPKDLLLKQFSILFSIVYYYEPVSFCLNYLDLVFQRLPKQCTKTSCRCNCLFHLTQPYRLKPMEFISISHHYTWHCCIYFHNVTFSIGHKKFDLL